MQFPFIIDIETNQLRTDPLGLILVVSHKRKITDIDLRYDGMTGYLGTNVKTGNPIMKVSEFDKILVIQKDGTYYCTNVSDRLFVGKDIAYCGLADKDSLEDLIFTAIYLDKKTKVTYIKRCKLSGFILNKPYALLPEPENNSLKKLSVYPNAEVTITYKNPTRMKESTVLFSDFLVKGAKAGGVTLSKKEIASIRIKPCKVVDSETKSVSESLADDEDDEPEKPATISEVEAKAPKKQLDDDMPGLFDDIGKSHRLQSSLRGQPHNHRQQTAWRDSPGRQDR